MADTSESTLHAEHVLEFAYTRSLGPVLSRFMTGLRDHEIVGIKAGDGRVLVPPVEYDPLTAEQLSEFADVGDAGEVTTWSWVSEPKPGKHPLDRPFAFALIRLDGADTAMLHAVDVGSPDAMQTGMRVQVRWAPPVASDADDGPRGVREIECFVPEESK